tara:strand:- start:223 stop:1332 length:1110 start_codon:yes stop_codon:yes gene_type:complete
MALSKIPSAGFQDNVKFRNILINGKMDISQRGSSATGLGNGDSGYHTCDRWNFGESGSTSAEFTQSQVDDAPAGQGFSKSLKMDCTTADSSPGASDLVFIAQKIEGQNLQHLKKGGSFAESTTVSFWVKSSKTGTYIVNFYDNDNTRNISKSYTISSADTWEKKIITFAGDTTGAFGNDAEESGILYFNLLAGSNFTSGTLQTSWGAYSAADYAVGQVNLGDNTSNDWYITGVQFETGTTASDFEVLPIDFNLDRCKRYFQKTYPLINSPGASTDDGMVFNRINGSYSNKPYPARFEKELRTNSPTITIYSKTGSSGHASDFGTGVSHSSNDAITTVYNIGSTGFGIVSGHGGDAGDSFAIHYTADAEL